MVEYSLFSGPMFNHAVSVKNYIAHFAWKIVLSVRLLTIYAKKDLPANTTGVLWLLMGG